MKVRRMGTLGAFLLVTIVSLTMNLNAAAMYPEKDIVIIAPAKPGGGNDIIGRLLSRYMPKYLPKQVNIIVQNIDAAGGRVGSFALYDAKPDGYTIGIMEPTTFVMAEILGGTKKRDVTQLSWLGRASDVPQGLAVYHQGPIKSVGDLKGRKVRAASGNQTLASSICIYQALNAEPKFVIYGGGAECCLATMRGDTDVVAQSFPTVVRQAEASGGRLIPLTVFSDKRASIAPNLPASKELGIIFPEDLKALLSYDYGIAAPPGLPADIKKILLEAIGKTFGDPNYLQDLMRAKYEPTILSSEEMQKRVGLVAVALQRYKETIRQVIRQ